MKDMDKINIIDEIEETEITDETEETIDANEAYREERLKQIDIWGACLATAFVTAGVTPIIALMGIAGGVLNEPDIFSESTHSPGCTDYTSELIGFMFFLIPIISYIGGLFSLKIDKALDFGNITPYGAVKSVIAMIPSVVILSFPFTFSPFAVAGYGLAIWGGLYLLKGIIQACLESFTHRYDDDNEN